MLSVCLNVSAATVSEGRSVTLTGIAMSKEEFCNIYATSERVRINKNDFIRCSLEMSGFEKLRETLKFDTRLFSKSGVDISFEVSGKLYSGYKNQISEINSVIVDAASSNDAVSILLFEMLFNVKDSIAKAQRDAKELRTYSGSFWTKDPSVSDSSIRLYLLKDDMVYMFEDDLPVVFQNYNREYIQMSDPTKDMLWFASLIPSTVEVRTEESDEMLAEALVGVDRSSSASEVLWTGGRTYYHSFMAYGDKYEQCSMP